MKLTELFTGEKQITDNGKSQAATVKNDVVNRQIRSMVPGQTIQGEVIAKNGNEVQIRVADDVILQAKLDQNMNLEVGKMMTFEVKNNGKTLTLSPLFTNVATDANVLKALDMASLPVNDTTVAIAKQLMAAGLSINRATLQQVYREVNLFPQSEVSDIVNLHKLQMSVNEANVNQMASYRNLTHQLVTGLNNVLDAVPDMFSQMMESGNTEGAVKLYQQLTLLANEGAIAEGTMNSGSGVAEQGALANSALVNDGGKTVITEAGGNTATAEGVATEAGTVADKALVKAAINQTLEIPVAAESSGKADNGTAANVQSYSAENGALQGSDGLLLATANQTKQNTTLVQHFTDLLGQIAKGTATPDALAQLNEIWKEMGGDKEFLKPTLQLLQNQWTITPEEVANPGSVEKLYNKINKQMKQLAQAMESLGQNNATAYKATVTLTQNLDFMQQMNQVYTYVQLPLRLQNGEAHGDLYVYSNKKHLSSEDGQVSALLHLDMEHLGPVDVYVSMKQNDVKTQFYLRDDEMLDFLMAHINILTERLQKRGYNCEYEMKVKDASAGETSSIHKMLLQENHVPLAEYAFDVRT